MDQDALSPTQRVALSQLQALTNGGDADVAISVLDSVGWDVQRAADVVFGSAPSAPFSISQPPSTAAATTTPEDTFEIDDSEQNGLLSGRPSGREFNRVSPSTSILSYLMRPLRLIIALLAVPYTILRAVLRTLHIPLPLPPVPLAFSLSGLGLNLGLSGRPGLSSAPVRDAKTAAERWVRALEEETGCVCISRSQVPFGEASGSAPGSSAAISRRQTDDAVARTLPDFFIGSYESFAKVCAKDSEPRIGCVVLVSEEHDDVAEFKRSTLPDPDFVRLIQENDILVWGGDIRDRDAWGASQKLQATTYPFVAFLALQPRRGASGSNPQKAALTVLSRHQGPSIPLASGPTSPRTLTIHLTEHLLPRVVPVLTRIRAQVADRDIALAVAARERDRERALRAEQDRAFAESAARDKERIERKMAEERATQEAERRRSADEQREREEAARAEEARREQEARRMAWRRWERRALLPREPRPGEQGRGRTVRVGVRMPDGRRAVRFFGEADALTAVFAFVDTLFIPDGREYAVEADPVAVPDGGAKGGEAALVAAMARETGVGAWWGFRLATVYPRKEIVWEPGRKVGEVEGLRHGGQLVVELDEDARSKGKGKGRASLEENGRDNDSDEYETESD